MIYDETPILRCPPAPIECSSGRTQPIVVRFEQHQIPGNAAMPFSQRAFIAMKCQCREMLWVFALEGVRDARNSVERLLTVSKEWCSPLSKPEIRERPSHSRR